MKPLLLVVVGLMAVAATACGGALTEIYMATVVSGVTTASNPDDLGGISESYSLKTREGVEHYVYLSSPDGNIAGLWDATANDFIIQANPESESRTITYTFSDGGIHEVFLRSLDSEIPSDYTFKIWIP